MGQGATHMTVINASNSAAVVSAHVHGVAQNTHEQVTVNVPPQQSSLLTVTRQGPGDYHVNWSVNFNNGTHAEWRGTLPPQTMSSSMLLGNANVTIDGQVVSRVKKGAAAHRPPPGAISGMYKTAVDVPPQALPRGRVIRLRSFKTGKNVRLHGDGRVDALGGEGPLTRLVIDPSPDGFMRIRSEKFPQHFLGMRPDAGQGGKKCHLRAQMVGPNRYILRSPDLSQGLGFRPDGAAKPPSEVAKGEGASFTITFADVQHPPAHGGPHGHPHGHPHAPPPHVPPPAHQAPYPHAPPGGPHHPPPHQPPHHPPHHRPPAAGGVNPLLRPGAMVRLRCKSTNQNARIREAGMDGSGGDGPFTKFKVNPSPNGYLRFESVKFPGRFLSWKGTPGSGGKFTEFVAQPSGQPNEFHFRSIDDKHALGFFNTGAVKEAAQVGRGPAGTFTIFAA